MCAKITRAAALLCDQRNLAAGESGVKVARTFDGVLALEQAVPSAGLSSISVNAILSA